MDKALRQKVFERDTHCVKCGRFLYDGVACHHRKLRKHGGPDHITNLIALCSPCHNIAPDSVHQNPAKSYEAGYLVKSWDDPASCPVVLDNGSRVLLTDDGEYLPIEETEASGGW